MFTSHSGHLPLYISKISHENNLEGEGNDILNRLKRVFHNRYMHVSGKKCNFPYIPRYIWLGNMIQMQQKILVRLTVAVCWQKNDNIPNLRQ